VDLAPPKDTEILVRTAYAGFCHTDWSVVSGALRFPLPLVLGHEAAGIVEEVGSAVTRVKKGDRVVATWMIPCGTCRQCTCGRGHICSVSDSLHGLGGLLDGTSASPGPTGRSSTTRSSCRGSPSTWCPLDLSRLLTGRFKLEGINAVYDAMTQREIEGRWICEFA